MSCKVIVSKTTVIVFLAMIKVIAMKLVKFLIAKSLKLISSNYRSFFEELKVELNRIVNKAILVAKHPV